MKTIQKKLKLWLSGCALGVAGLSVSAPVWAEEGYAGGNIAISNVTADLGVFSLIETSVDMTRVGANFFYNNEGDKMLSADIQVNRKGLTTNNNLEFGVKAKAFYLTQDALKDNGYGLMLGLTGRFWLPTEMPAGVFVEALHSPQIITGGNTEAVTDMLVRAEVRILPKVNVFLGYRLLSVDFSQVKDSYEFDSNAHIGVEVGF